MNVKRITSFLCSAAIAFAGLQMPAFTAEAAEYSYASTPAAASIALKIGCVDVTMEELQKYNGQVLVPVVLSPNPGVTALEFGVSCNLNYQILTADDVKSDDDGRNPYLDNAVAPKSQMKFLGDMVYSSTVYNDENFSWLTWANSRPKTREGCVFLLVDVPKTAREGDIFPITIRTTGLSGNLVICESKDDKGGINYIQSAKFSIGDGYIQITGKGSPAPTDPTEPTTIVAPPVENIPGDADGSGSLDILDVITLNKFILGVSSSNSARITKVCDVNKDGRCDARDVLLILKFSLGIITKFDPAEPTTEPATPTTTETTTTEPPTTETTEPTTIVKPLPTMPPETIPTETVPTVVPSVDERVQVAKIVNQERAKNGLPALKYSEKLAEAAQARAIETISLFSHSRPNGTMCFTILDEYGIQISAAAENIAYGDSTPEEVMNTWMNSTGHRKNILSSKVSYIGVGCYTVGRTKYWVQIFVNSPNLDGYNP